MFISRLLSWLGGILFISTGFFVLDQSVTAAIMLFSAALVILPFSRHFVDEKWNLSLSTGRRFFVILMLMFGASYFIGQAEKADLLVKNQLKTAEIVAEKAADLAKFKENPAEMLAIIRENVDKGRFQIALNYASRYLSTENPELLALHQQARRGKAVKAAHLKVKRLDQSSEHYPKAGLAAYEALVTLFPDQVRYQKKRDNFKEKVRIQAEGVAERKAVIQAALANALKHQQAYKQKFGDAPALVSAGGFKTVPLGVDRYLSANAHNPNSIEIVACGKAYLSADGWNVRCTYDGTNKFNATVRTTRVFVLVDNAVVSVVSVDR